MCALVILVIKTKNACNIRSLEIKWHCFLLNKLDDDLEAPVT